METLHKIIIGLLTNAIWALGGFLLTYLIKKLYSGTYMSPFNSFFSVLHNKKSAVTPVITAAVITEVTYHGSPVCTSPNKKTL